MSFSFRLILILTTLLCLTSCRQSGDLTSAGLPGGAASLAGAVDPDAYMEVDCLLPGQVRKLGTMLYASPRRPLKTTANDCSIRGGEYVVFDRANYKQALAIWMVEAEGGDPVAQTYVGEIYLKSPKGAPRYDLAAKWFEKAASNGHKRAQVNLGYLYENGLGVAADREVAAQWYSKASGSKLQDIVQQQQLTVAEREEFEQLRESNAAQLAELREIRKEKDRLTVSLQSAEKELTSSRSSIVQAQQEIESRRRDLAALESQLDQHQSKNAETYGKRLVELQEGLAAKEIEVQRYREQATQLGDLVENHEHKVRGLEESLAQAKEVLGDVGAASKRSKSEIVALQRENSSQLAELERLNQEKVAAEKRLADLAKKLSDSENLVTKQKLAIEQRETELEQSNRKLSGQTAGSKKEIEKKVAELRKTLEVKELELTKQKKLAADLTQQISQQKSATVTYQKTLSDLNNRLANLPGPKIEVIDPQLLRTRGITVARVEKPRVERIVTGKVWFPAGLKAFTVNGVETEVKEDGSFRSPQLMTDEKKEVTITALDQNDRREEVSFTLQKFESRASSEDNVAGSNQSQTNSIKFGKYYALVIGNNNYRELPKLKTAVEDARVVSELLKTVYGFEVTTLYNANRNEILSTMNEYRKTLTENDNFLIYYAGHGTLEERNTQGFWLPVDSALDNDVNWIPTDRITGIMNLMSAKQIMVVADACYSGIMTRASLTRLESGKSREAYDKWLKKMAGYKSRVIISSGETKPVLDGGGGKHSVFAKALLDTLRDNRRILLGIDLHRAIAEKVVDASGRIGLDQVPQYAGLNRAGHELGDFLFIPKNRS